MTGNCHKIVGMSLGVVSAMLISGSDSISTCAIGLVAGALGGLVPDIDKRGSKISHKAPITSTIAEAVLGHRGIMHTPLMAIIISTILFILNKLKGNDVTDIAVITFFIGYISHILLDTITPAGTMLLYPLSKKRIHIIGIKGKIVELAIMIVSVLMVAININLI